MFALRCAVLLCALVFASAAAAEVLYTWIDASGRVQYSDQPPKGFTGEVKRLDIDTTLATPTVPATPAKPAAREDPKAKPAPPADINSKRRANRERLQRELDAAREKLALAQRALAEHQDPEVDERQIVQRPGAGAKAVPMPGRVQASARSNCREVERNGKKAVMCPVSAPGEAYFERIGKLEQAVKDAEEEVAAAERAYRRGVD